VFDRATLERALEERDQGNAEAALALLKADAAQRPGDADTVRVFWETAVAAGREAEAVPAVLALIRGALRRGDAESAIQAWLPLTDRIPGVEADPGLLLKLAPVLAESGRPSRAAAALRLALLDPEDRLTAATALHIAREAKRVDPNLARAAARTALARPDLTPAERAGAELLLGAEGSAPAPARR
jgi:hypothetical protein